MPRSIALLAAVLMALSGCSARTADADGSDEPLLVRDPSDFSYLNRSDDTQEHLHDYWNGQERLVVLAQTYSGGYISGAEIVAGRFRPDPGPGVPQGAARVEITVDWSERPDNVYDGPDLWVKTAADHAPVKVGPLKARETVVVEASNEKNDLPHQRLSGWEFQVRVRPKAPTPAVSWSNTINIRVEAVRGLDIPLYPGHPDAWAGRSEQDLLSDKRSTIVFVERDGLQACGASTCMTLPHKPSDGALVPWNAKKIIVEVTHDSAASQRLGLNYHDSDSWATKHAPFTASGTKRTFTIEVGVGDGPYAKQSSWEFLVFVDDNAPAQVWTGGYTITGVVYRNG